MRLKGVNVPDWGGCTRRLGKANHLLTDFAERHSHKGLVPAVGERIRDFSHRVSEVLIWQRPGYCGIRDEHTRVSYIAAGERSAFEVFHHQFSLTHERRVVRNPRERTVRAACIEGKASFDQKLLKRESPNADAESLNQCL